MFLRKRFIKKEKETQIKFNPEFALIGLRTPRPCNESDYLFVIKFDKTCPTDVRTQLRFRRTWANFSWTLFDDQLLFAAQHD